MINQVCKNKFALFNQMRTFNKFQLINLTFLLNLIVSLSLSLLRLKMSTSFNFVDKQLTL